MVAIRKWIGGAAKGDKLIASVAHSFDRPLQANNLRRIRWLAVVLPTLAIGLFEFLRHGWLASVLPVWLGFGWFGNVAGALVVGISIYGFVRVFSHMIESSALQATRAREEAAVLAERQRIAREMHDGVAQALFYMTVKLREVDSLLPQDGVQPARKELQDARTNLEQTYLQVREVVSDLKRQAELEDFSEALRRTAAVAAQRFGLRVECRIDAGLEPAANHKQHLLAIVQEALSNARRHGNATDSLLRAHRVDRQLIVEVADEGSGFDTEAALDNGSHGLTIMSERAKMVGGELSVDSRPGHGARVTVRLPEARP